MPEEAYWESLFDVPLILSRLGVTKYEDVAELGCGYGTFTVPIARIIRGKVYAYDIDPDMLARTRERAGSLPIVCENRDVLESGFGIQVDAILLFNILHCEQPKRLLRHAADAAKDVLVIHWQHGATPRGPSLDIRPRPERIVEWAEAAGLRLSDGPIDLPPWHYGLKFSSASEGD